MTLIETDLIEAYKHLRFYLDHILIVNCGYRCPQHNAEIGGMPLSQHQAGRAIDISLVGIDIPHEKILKLAEQAGFKYYYIDKEKNFMHCDVRSAN
jgi:uncharacterized protein YcbK (DUF882 family)